MLLHQFVSALMFVLIAAMLISLLIGHWQDAVVIAAASLLNALIGLIQEYRAENAIAALMKLISPRALGVRAGGRTTSPSASYQRGGTPLASRFTDPLARGNRDRFDESGYRRPLR